MVGSGGQAGAESAAPSGRVAVLVPRHIRHRGRPRALLGRALGIWARDRQLRGLALASWPSRRRRCGKCPSRPHVLRGAADAAGPSSRVRVSSPGSPRSPCPVGIEHVVVDLTNNRAAAVRSPLPQPPPRRTEARVTPIQSSQPLRPQFIPLNGRADARGASQTWSGPSGCAGLSAPPARPHPSPTTRLCGKSHRHAIRPNRFRLPHLQPESGAEIWPSRSSGARPVSMLNLVGMARKTA